MCLVIRREFTYVFAPVSVPHHCRHLRPSLAGPRPARDLDAGCTIKRPIICNDREALSVSADSTSCNFSPTNCNLRTDLSLCGAPSKYIPRSIVRISFEQHIACGRPACTSQDGTRTRTGTLSLRTTIIKSRDRPVHRPDTYAASRARLRSKADGSITHSIVGNPVAFSLQ